jgi:predicted AAA+ superfamily ATPase
MITEETLRTIIKENNQPAISIPLVKREKEVPLDGSSIIVITGVRRCGKSTLLQQSLESIRNKVFLNFEDTRLEGFDLGDFQKLEQLAVSENATCYIFDEIQNIQGWEKYVRSAHDKGFQIFITGSNASMLSRELGTRLTGRHIQSELFPFNYQEYLLFTKETASKESLINHLTNGGFPEFLVTRNPEYLRSLFRDIVIRDIAVRRNIKNENTILRLALHLMSNVGKELSFNNISKVLGIKSVRTTIDYCDYLKESYLMDMVPRFSYSIKQQLNNPKKAYAVDTGMARANSLSFSEDKGRMLENSVFLQLRQATPDILYYKDTHSECDFLIRKNEKIVYAVQVCWHITEGNLERETMGLKSAMAATGVKSGIIITSDQEDTFAGIKAIPAWKWEMPKVS